MKIYHDLTHDQFAILARTAIKRHANDTVYDIIPLYLKSKYNAIYHMNDDYGIIEFETLKDYIWFKLSI